MQLSTGQTIIGFNREHRSTYLLPVFKVDPMSWPDLLREPKIAEKLLGFCTVPERTGFLILDSNGVPRIEVLHSAFGRYCQCVVPPETVRRVLLRCEKNGAYVAAFVHTHSGSVAPSEIDLAGARGDRIPWIIV